MRGFICFFKQTCVSYKSKRRQACSVGLSWPYYEDKFLGAGNRREKETKHVEYRLLWSCNSWAYEKTNMWDIDCFGPTVGHICSL